MVYFSGMKKIYIVLSFCLAYGVVNATSLNELHSKKGVNHVDLSFASSFQNAGAVALSWQRLIQPQFIKSERFFVGYGLRFTSSGSQNKPFVTAPAKVSEGNFFKKQNEDKLDTLYLNNSNTNSLNWAIYLAYNVSSKLQLEFNIDAIGFTFGADQQGRYEAVSQGYPSSTENASVTTFNALLTGDYDWGSLNSELSLNYTFKDRWQLRPGLAFIFSEYTTSRKLAFNNDRYRNKSLYPMLAVRYRL